MRDYQTLVRTMKRVYEETTGISIEDASDIGIRFQVLAGELEKLYQEMEELEQQLFPQTSTGKYLDLHAEQRGLVRNKGAYAKGYLEFRREQPAQTDIEIPTHRLVSTNTEPPREYLTLEKTVIKKGETAASAKARAIAIGAIGNCVKDNINLMVSIVPGVTQVRNVTPFTGGREDEGDDSLRKRILENYQYISNGTNAAFYHNIAAAEPEVHAVSVLPRRRGRGTVDVVFQGVETDKEEALTRTLYSKLQREKEVNVDVSVFPADKRSVPISVRIAVSEEYDFSKVREHCLKKLEAFFQTLGIGKPLLLTHLGSVLLQVEGVDNYSILSPVADVVPLATQVVTPSSVVIERQAGL